MLLVVDDEEADDRKKSLLMAPTQAFVDDSARWDFKDALSFPMN